MKNILFVIVAVMVMLCIPHAAIAQPAGGGGGVITYSNVVNAWNAGGPCTGFLYYDGTCSSGVFNGGTITASMTIDVAGDANFSLDRNNYLADESLIRWMDAGVTKWTLGQRDNVNTMYFTYAQDLTALYGWVLTQEDASYEFTASTAINQKVFGVLPEIAQSGSAGYTGIYLDVTQTSLGSGDNYLMDLRADGTSKFSVSNGGEVIANSVEISGGDIQDQLDTLTTAVAGKQDIVTEGSLPDGVIVAADVKSGTLTNTQISASAAIARSKIAAWGSPTTRDADATPEVAHGGFYKFTNTGALTITDLVDGDGDYSDFNAGDEILVLLDDSDITLGFKDNAGLYRVGDIDFTADASYPIYLHWYFDGSKWVCDNIPPGLTSPLAWGFASTSMASYAHFSGADATYNDDTTPHVLTSAETKNKSLTNCGATADKEYSMAAIEFGENFIMMVCAAWKMELSPPSGKAFWLNGTQMTADEHIVNAGDTKGEIMTCFSVETSDDVYELFCESKYTNWAQETP